MTDDSFDIRGRVAVITGGYGVLGGGMADCLLRAGAKIGVLGRNEQSAEQKALELCEAGGEALPLCADVTELGQVEASCEQVLETWGRLDILVNAAGGNVASATVGPDQDLFGLSLDGFREVTDLNLHGTVIPTLAFGRHMAEQRRGRIVNVSSMAAQRALTRVVGYSASKAAVDAFTRWMAVEMARRYGEGITVNAIAPGFFLTKQNRSLLVESDGSYTPRGRTIVDQTPMARFGRPEELDGVLRWLCSDAASFVTGTVIPVDGGFGAFSGV